MYTITVVLLTYNRLEYAKRTLITLGEHIVRDPRYCKLNLWIDDDGSPEGYLRELGDLASNLLVFDSVDTHWHPNVGYGGNYNLAMKYVRQVSDYILPLEDDWELMHSLDISDLAEALKELGGGCIRLGYMGYTQPLHGTFKYARGRHWLLLDPTSPEPHVFAGHPRLETVAWNKALGDWPERTEQGATEFEVTHRAPARRDVYWPVDLVKPSGDLFAHIGTIKA